MNISTSNQTAAPEYPPAEQRFVGAILAGAGLLQSLLMAMTGFAPWNVLGMILGTGTLALAVLPQPANRFRLPAMWVFTAAIIGNLAIHFSTPGAGAHHLLLMAVILGYTGIFAGGLLAVATRIRAENALLLCVSTAFALWTVNALISFLPGSRNLAEGGLRWQGSTAPHPVLGEVYAPYSTLRTLYPGNPRHYFDEPDPASRFWQLDVHDSGSEATLVPQGDGTGILGVQVTRAATPTLWHVQIREPGLDLRPDKYELSFRARADQPRKTAIGVSQNHAPWESAGLYEELELGPEWREYRREFATASADSNLQIHLDVGGATGHVDFAAVTLRRLSDGHKVEPQLPKEYSVSYHFNGLGCRGPDYSIPKPPGRRRILVLGDSFAMGVGVHLPHTFEAKLQESLNRGAPAGVPAYEVINCGVSGYSTKEERLFFELTAARYQPDIVLLMMVSNDDRSWSDDVRLGYYHEPTEAEDRIALWRMVQTARHEGARPESDFRPNIEEVLKLNEDCKRNQARLAVAFFRNEELSGDWKKLVETVSTGLQGKGIPAIDVGVEMMRGHNPEELAVYPQVDGHPSEIAHASAASQIERLLRKEQWIQ